MVTAQPENPSIRLEIRIKRYSDQIAQVASSNNFILERYDII
jgi:hypothetical protein